jgi:hypothetical protein
MLDAVIGVALRSDGSVVAITDVGSGFRLDTIAR